MCFDSLVRETGVSRHSSFQTTCVLLCSRSIVDIHSKIRHSRYILTYLDHHLVHVTWLSSILVDFSNRFIREADLELSAREFAVVFGVTCGYVPVTWFELQDFLTPILSSFT